MGIPRCEVALQAASWGRRGVHYHQFLKAGENTLNFRLAVELAALIREDGGYDPARWLDRYVAFMLEPGRHRDTYVEEYHRNFFTRYAAGTKPLRCGGRDVHIGGLAPVPAMVAALGPTHPGLREAVRATSGDDLRAAILEEGSDWISAAVLRRWEGLPDRTVVGAVLSPACYIPDAFPAALALAWRHAGDFGAGVVANAAVGGDGCHRGAVVGSLLGATAAIPEGLVEGLVARDTVMGIFAAGTAPVAAGESVPRNPPS